MKIVNIEPTYDSGIDAGTFKMFSSNITTKNFFGRKKTFKVSPTNMGPTFGSSFIHYYFFIDQFGKRLDDDLCEQLTNYFRFKQ